MCFENNNNNNNDKNDNNKRHCLYSVPKVSNKKSFKRKVFGEFLCHKGKTVLYKEEFYV